MTNIDPGIPTEKKGVSVSLNYQYASEDADTQKYSKTTYSSSSYDPTSTYINDTYLYESRHYFGGDVMFTFLDFMAVGLLFDISLGDLPFRIEEEKNILNNNIYELAVFLRFFGKFDNLTIGFRPEIVLNSINYYKEVYYFDDTISTVPDSMVMDEGQHHSAAFRGTLFMRYEFLKYFSLFCGFQYKRQPYTLEDRSSARRAGSRIKSENVFGVYCGFGVEPIAGLHFCPYGSFPIKTDITDYRSPIYGGLKCVVDIGKLYKDTENKENKE
jgi:hypothetical protein